MVTPLLLSILFFVQFIYSWSFTPCHIEPDKPVEYIIDESHRPENKYKNVEIPTDLDWRWKDGQRYTTWTRNQHSFVLFI